MKIAVTGPNGQLGSELVRQGCIPIQSNLLSWQLLSSELERIGRLDAIINCAAMTDVDGCESKMPDASLSNASGVSVLSNLFDGYLIQISTDYIFDGHNGPYITSAKPNPLGIYGWSKLGGELTIAKHSAPWLIIRTTILFSQSENNFVSKVVKRLRFGQTIELWQPRLNGTPTYVPALASEIIRMVNEGYTGTAHVAGDKLWTRLMFAKEVAKAFRFDESLIVANEQPPTGAPRPVNAGLICGHSGGLPVDTHNPLYGLKALAQIAN